jgi:hypothetical protein
MAVVRAMGGEVAGDAMTDDDVTDRLLFLDVPGVVGRHMVRWHGPWPPPDRMAVVMQGPPVGPRVGIVTEAENITPEWLRDAHATTLVPLFFRLRNCSQAPNPAGPDDHWFRGAEYVPEEQP